MLVFSILEMFKIGVGPSSSHTVGPMVAAHEFVTALERDGSPNGQVARTVPDPWRLPDWGMVPIDTVAGLKAICRKASILTM